MNRKRQFLLIGIILLLATTSCRLPSVFGPKVEVIKHEKPSLPEMDISPFTGLGCDWKEGGYAHCEEDSAADTIGCQTLYTPSGYYGFLTPQLPLVRCYYFPDDFSYDEDGDTGLFFAGCAMPVYERLIIYQNEEYILIQNREDLKKTFAPIESEEEALAYALAAYDSYPLFNFEPPKEYRYFLDSIEETKVTETEEGYEVLIYSYQFCGCGPHTTYQQNILVTRAGDLKMLNSVSAFEDPEEDGLCVD